jgi:hypothetical protein
MRGVRRVVMRPVWHGAAGAGVGSSLTSSGKAGATLTRLVITFPFAPTVGSQGTIHLRCG